jgi:hypothetical protein
LISFYVLLRFEIFTAVTMKNAVFWDATPCGSCRRDVSEECIDSITRVRRISELGTTFSVAIKAPHCEETLTRG